MKNPFTSIRAAYRKFKRVRELDIEAGELRIQRFQLCENVKELQGENKKHILTIEQKDKDFQDAVRQIVDLRAKLAHYEASHLNFYAHVSETLREWEKVAHLVRLDVFRSLVRFIAKEYEKIFVDEISTPEQAHKFWHIQGAKSVLHQLLTYEAIVKEKMNKLAGIQKPSEDGGKAPDLSYE